MFRYAHIGEIIVHVTNTNDLLLLTCHGNVMCLNIVAALATICIIVVQTLLYCIKVLTSPSCKVAHQLCMARACIIIVRVNTVIWAAVQRPVQPDFPHKLHESVDKKQHKLARLRVLQRTVCDESRCGRFSIHSCAAY